jgi:hypothetical protein
MPTDAYRCFMATDIDAGDREFRPAEGRAAGADAGRVDVRRAVSPLSSSAMIEIQETRHVATPISSRRFFRYFSASWGDFLARWIHSHRRRCVDRRRRGDGWRSPHRRLAVGCTWLMYASYPIAWVVSHVILAATSSSPPGSRWCSVTARPDAANLRQEANLYVQRQPDKDRARYSQF